MSLLQPTPQEMIDSDWDFVYEKAIRPDGSLLFPARLNKTFLDNARRTMGSYLFANQYQNEVIPEDEKNFKPQWIRYYKEIPKNTYRFGFIDPAIGQKDRHDYTGICVVDVDCDGNWYLRLATRYRLSPTQIVAKMFELHDQFQLRALGVEIVAYQEALLYILDEEMKRKKRVIPVTGITRNNISKNVRILGLVPRFEWGRIFVAQGLTDFEDEYASFPRGSHDDVLDALASLENVVHYPQKEEAKVEKPHSPIDPNYERWYIRELGKRAARGQD